jgi:enediyne biosynthesis protein E4
VTGRRRASAAGLFALMLAAVCGADMQPGAGFTDATAGSGIDFVHHAQRSAERLLPEVFGSGAVFFDFDGDGNADLFLLDAGTQAPPGPPAGGGNRLYRGRGDGTFQDVTQGSGLGGQFQGYAMGAVAADYDGDGDEDLYLTGLGPNVLYRNNGDGTFTDVTAEAGVGTAAWSTAAAFADFDGDGDLDLYVVNYLEWTPAVNKPCHFPRSSVRTYCHPKLYNAAADVLYRNDGGGKLTDVSEAAGIANPIDGKGLGLIVSDLDGDGHMDVYVANDTMRNSLFRGRGDGTFEDVGFAAGVGYDELGRAQGSMGVDAADVDGDGRFDLFTTNYEGEANALYRNVAPGLFEERGAALGLARDPAPLAGFGAAFLDYDNDGWQDLAVVNGHIIVNRGEHDARASALEPGLLYRNTGAGFVSVAAAAPELARPRLGRGLAVADVDGDGDLDLVLTENGGRAVLLRNELSGPGRHWLQVELEAPGPNRQAIGARVRVLAGGRWQVREVRSGGSYLSHHQRGLHFGLGEAGAFERIEVRWPGGRLELFEGGAADRRLRLRRGAGAPG